jgi:hypothetical protein
MHRASRMFRLVAAAGLASALVIPAAAVSAASPLGPAPAFVTMELPTTPIVCQKEWDAYARVTDANGVRLAGVTVHWGMAPVVSSQDGITASESTTDANGLATTKVALDCLPGSRTLMAMAGTAQGQAVLPISTEGMPAAEAAPPAPPVKAAHLILSVPPGPLPCGTRTVVSLVVLAADGGTIAGAKVIWTLDPFGSVNDIWGADVTYTGSQGGTGNAVWPACEPGRRILNAWVDGVSAAYQLEVNPVAAVASEPPMPEPSAAVTPPPTSVDAGGVASRTGSAAFLGLVLLIVGGAGIMALQAHRARGQQ